MSILPNVARWEVWLNLPKLMDSQSKARQVLETMLSYTLHKPRRRHFPTLPVMAFKVDQQWVMDLMDVQKLAKWNKGRFLQRFSS